MSIAAAQGGAFTIDDLDRFPDDGLRYELVDGTLIVTAAPSRLHQHLCTQILHLLHAACPPGVVALVGPSEVIGGNATLLQPDVLVVRASDIRASRHEVLPPLLVVEVASPSTRRIDQTVKRSGYRDAGVGAYWVADPHTPSVTALRWDGDEETEQTVRGGETLAVTWPCPVDLCPADLVAIET